MTRRALEMAPLGREGTPADVESDGLLRRAWAIRRDLQLTIDAIRRQ